MDRVHDGFRAAFAALGVGALLAMASSCGPSTPAFAAGEVIAVAGCDVVVAPTPEVHTECPGWDATGIDTFPGIETVSWDYADLSGATIRGPLLLSGSSQDVVGIDLSGAFVSSQTHWTGSEWVGGLSLSEANLDGSTWYGMWDTDLTNVSAVGMVIASGYLFSGTWTRADLTDAQLLSQASSWSLASDSTITDMLLPQSIDNSTLAIDFAVVTIPSYFSLTSNDLRGSSFANVELGTVGVTTFVSNDLRGVSFANLTVAANGVSFSSAGFEMTRFDAPDFSGTTVAAGAFLRFESSEMLDEANFTGMHIDGEFTISGSGSWIYHPEVFTADGADFSGTHFSSTASLSLESLSLIAADFTGVEVEDGGRINIANSYLNSADLSGVNWTGYDVYLGNNNFAYADFTGAAVRFAGRSYFGYADMSNADIYGNLYESAFHHTNLSGARFVAYDNASPYGVGVGDTTEFIDADLTGADLSGMSNINDVVFLRSDLSGADLVSNHYPWWNRTVMIGSDFTGARFPSDLLANQYGLAVSDAHVGGTGWLYDASNTPSSASATIASGETSVVVNWDLPDLWRASDGELPYGDDWDGEDWNGGMLLCDHWPGEAYSVGETEVTCSARIYQRDSQSGLYSPASAVELDLATLTPERDIDSTIWCALQGLGESAEAAPAPLAPAALVHGPYDEFVQPTAYGAGYGYCDTPNWYTETARASFLVTVNEAPTIAGDPPTGTEGVAYPAFAFDLTGFPVADVAVVAGVLPAGLTLNADGTLTGTPAAGSAGEYPLTVRASSDAGTDTAEVVLVVHRAPFLGGQYERGTELVEYEDCLAVDGAPAPVVSLVAGSLPAGLALGADGCVRGTPEAGSAGDYPLTLRATNDAGEFEFETTLSIATTPTTPAAPTGGMPMAWGVIILLALLAASGAGAAAAVRRA